MVFEKGKFSFIINKIGGISLTYRRFCFEIGFFNTDEEIDGIPLFSFRFFNFYKGKQKVKIFEVFSLQILKFNISIDVL